MTHDAEVNAVSFSPDSRLVASGSGDNTVRVHRWRPEDLIAEACSRLTRNLTKGEWRLYLGDEPYQKTCKHLPEEK
jgi:WD40 repeat protein